MPEKISYILNTCKEIPLSNNFNLFNNSVFPISSYNYILIGNKIINNEIIKKNFIFMLDEIKIQNYENILNNQKILIPNLLTHNDFIDTVIRG